MKVWIKLLVGSVLGIALGFLLPENSRIMEGLVWLEQFALHIGRYVVVPVLFFLLITGIYELRQHGQFWPLVLKSFLMIAGITVVMITVGILATVAFPPARIPILTEEQIEVIDLDIAENIKALFPYNMFSVLAGDGVYLFPACILALFFGMGLSYDRSYSKPVVALVDSLSHVFYHIASFFIEILGFIMIVLACYWAVHFKEVLQADVFSDLIVLIGILAAVLGFGIFPLLICFIRPRSNPWKVLYGSVGPGIAAFFSGDINFSLPVLLRHTQENFGMQRRSNAITLTLFSTFCRAGSAMVTTVAFIVISKSYSSLGITFMELLSIGIHAFIISFLLVRHPGDGAYTALAVLCLGYGRGFEAGYLILKPLAFYLIAAGTFLDVMIASFATFAAGRTSGLVEEKGASHFI